MANLRVEPQVDLSTSDLNIEGLPLRPLLMKLLNNNKTQVDTLLNSMDKGESLPVIASKLSNATYVLGQKKSGNFLGEWCNNLFFETKPLEWAHTLQISELCWCRSLTGPMGMRVVRDKIIDGKTLVVLEFGKGQKRHNKIVEVMPSQKFKSFAIVNWQGGYYLILVGLDEEGVWRMWVADLRRGRAPFNRFSVIDNWYFENERTFDINATWPTNNSTLGGFFANEYLLFNKFPKRTFNFPLGSVF